MSLESFGAYCFQPRALGSLGLWEFRGVEIWEAGACRRFRNSSVQPSGFESLGLGARVTLSPHQSEAYNDHGDV